MSTIPRPLAYLLRRAVDFTQQIAFPALVLGGILAGVGVLTGSRIVAIVGFAAMVPFTLALLFVLLGGALVLAPAYTFRLVEPYSPRIFGFPVLAALASALVFAAAATMLGLLLLSGVSDGSSIWYRGMPID